MAFGKETLGLILLIACTGNDKEDSKPSPADAAPDAQLASTDALPDAASEVRNELDFYRGLIGHWNFEDRPGSDVSDDSGMENTGIVVQGTVPEAALTTAQKATGQFGFGLDLAGQSTWVRVPVSQSINSTGLTGNFSVSAWIKPRATEANGKLQWVISRNEDGTNFPQFGMSLDNGHPRLHSHFFSANSDEIVPVGKWSHIAGSFNGIDLTLYVDGLVKKEISIGHPISQDKTNVVIGAAQSIDTMTGFFNGVIDDVRLFNTTLTAEQVKQLAQRP